MLIFQTCSSNVESVVIKYNHIRGMERPDGHHTMIVRRLGVMEVVDQQGINLTLKVYNNFMKLTEVVYVDCYN